MASGATVAQQPTSLTTVVTETTHVQYSRQESTESGWDNPFRPGGELSREAEEIVELIKGGKPITPTPGSVAPGLPSVDETDVAATPATTPASTVDAASPLTQSPVKKSTANELNATPKSTTNNGYTANNATAPASKTAKQPASPGAVDVKRDNVGAPADGSQVEHVVLKKKPRCKCCVIQ